MTMHTLCIHLLGGDDMSLSSDNNEDVLINILMFLSSRFFILVRSWFWGCFSINSRAVCPWAFTILPSTLPDFSITLLSLQCCLRSAKCNGVSWLLFTMFGSHDGSLTINLATIGFLHRLASCSAVLPSLSCTFESQPCSVIRALTTSTGCIQHARWRRVFPSKLLNFDMIHLCLFFSNSFIRSSGPWVPCSKAASSSLSGILTEKIRKNS